MEFYCERQKRMNGSWKGIWINMEYWIRTVILDYVYMLLGIIDWRQSDRSIELLEKVRGMGFPT